MGSVWKTQEKAVAEFRVLMLSSLLPWKLSRGNGRSRGWCCAHSLQVPCPPRAPSFSECLAHLPGWATISSGSAPHLDPPALICLRFLILDCFLETSVLLSASPRVSISKEGIPGFPCPPLFGTWCRSPFSCTDVKPWCDPMRCDSFSWGGVRNSPLTSARNQNRLMSWCLQVQLTKTVGLLGLVTEHRWPPNSHTTKMSHPSMDSDCLVAVGRLLFS